MHLLTLFISVLFELQADGSAIVTEKWDIDVSSGTEMYLERGNLDDIVISDFRVSEDGREYLVEDDWNINRSLEEKAGRCGMTKVRDGVELCWGTGSYGHHLYNISYRMSNAVNSLRDYDVFHIQAVSPGINPSPGSVTVTVAAPQALDSGNAGIWGFGYVGTVDFTGDGKVLYASSEPFVRESSVIALIRFDKGIFNSTSIVDKDFNEVLDNALNGASFSDDIDSGDADALLGFLSFLACVAFAIGLGKLIVNGNEKRVLGCRIKEVGWSRDVPFDGDILQSSLTVDSLMGRFKQYPAAAMVLRMIYNGYIVSSKNSRDEVELSFRDGADLSGMNRPERELYDMMKEASGRDLILQKKEFRRWSRMHATRVEKWNSSIRLEAVEAARSAGNISGGTFPSNRFTERGQENARKLVGLKKFLGDFTLIDERSTGEVVLWKDYLVFAALFGIADKVARELREINPEAFEQINRNDSDTIFKTIYLSRIMADSITNVAAVNRAAGASRGGFGGHSSFGGGGGFHGGGFGGGVR